MVNGGADFTVGGLGAKTEQTTHPEVREGLDLGRNPRTWGSISDLFCGGIERRAGGVSRN